MTLNDILTIAGLIVTPVSLWVAYLVFKLQAATFEAQTAVTKLEQKKFLYSIRPQFAIDTRPPDRAGDLHVLVNLQKNAALNLEFKWRNHFSGLPAKSAPLSACSVGFAAFIYRGKWPLAAEPHEFSLDIYFTDEIGTRYLQTVFGDVRSLSITPPKQINELNSSLYL